MTGNYYEMPTEQILALPIEDMNGMRVAGSPTNALLERLPTEQILALEREVHERVLERAKVNRLTAINLIEGVLASERSAAYYQASGEHEQKTAAADAVSLARFRAIAQLLATAAAAGKDINPRYTYLEPEDMPL